MRILYSHRIQSRDGQSVHVEEMVAAFRAAGHEVLVVGPGFYDTADFGGESGWVARIRAWLPAILSECAELAYNIPAYFRLRRACQTFQPDLLYERYNLYYFPAVWLARKRRFVFYLEVNAPLAEERGRFGGLQLRRLAHWLEGKTWRAADRVLAVTGVLRDMIVTKGVPATRVVVTHNGIDPAQFHPRAPDPASSGRIVLGFVGFVRAWHGLDGVIRAMGSEMRTADLSLVIVGEGPARADLEALAVEHHSADRVNFVGLAARANIPALIENFDIALQPRVVAYASPLKIFEYMAAGKAIIAPDQPNIREILVHEETALLFNPDEADGMWRAILRLAGDAGLRQRLGAAARAAIVHRDFTWAGNAARVTRWVAEDLEQL